MLLDYANGAIRNVLVGTPAGAIAAGGKFSYSFFNADKDQVIDSSMKAINAVNMSGVKYDAIRKDGTYYNQMVSEMAKPSFYQTISEHKDKYNEEASRRMSDVLSARLHGEVMPSVAKAMQSQVMNLTESLVTLGISREAIGRDIISLEVGENGNIRAIRNPSALPAKTGTGIDIRNRDKIDSLVNSHVSQFNAKIAPKVNQWIRAKAHTAMSDNYAQYASNALNIFQNLTNAQGE